jgi:hypothetical protein
VAYATGAFGYQSGFYARKLDKSGRVVITSWAVLQKNVIDPQRQVERSVRVELMRHRPADCRTPAADTCVFEAGLVCRA